MNLVWRLATGLVGLVNVALGLIFLIHPAEIAPQFFLEPLGTQGLASLRSDYSALFLTGGLFALLGAWRADPAPLRIPLVLLVIAFAGRTLSLVVDGVAPTAWPPFALEALMVLLLALGAAAFARRA